MTASRRFIADSRLLVAGLSMCLGAAGCAASTGEEPNTHLIVEANYTGSVISVFATSSNQLYAEGCKSVVQLKKRSGTEWIPWQDDRPSDGALQSYYVDDRFVLETVVDPCDAAACIPHPAFNSTHSLALMTWNFEAREYVKIGTRARPSGTAAEVDELESRPLTGDVQVVYNYYTDANCETPRLEIGDELTIPAH